MKVNLLTRISGPFEFYLKNIAVLLNLWCPSGLFLLFLLTDCKHSGAIRLAVNETPALFVT